MPGARSRVAAAQVRVEQRARLGPRDAQRPLLPSRRPVLRSDAHLVHYFAACDAPPACGGGQLRTWRLRAGPAPTGTSRRCFSFLGPRRAVVIPAFCQGSRAARPRPAKAPRLQYSRCVSAEQRSDTTTSPRPPSSPIRPERALRLAGHRLAQASALARDRWPAGEHDRARPAGASEQSKRAATRVRPWAVGVLAELARAAARVRVRTPCRDARPAGLRLLADARRTDLDRGLRAPARAAAGRARDRCGGGRGQLDGRLHRRRARDRVPAARRAARAGLRGGASRPARKPRRARRARCRRCAAWNVSCSRPAPRLPPDPTRSRDVHACARRC